MSSPLLLCTDLQVPLHDRELERDRLKEHVETPPRTFLCLLGPRNSGKSTLLEWMVSEGPFKGNAMLLDCRVLQGSNPNDFAKAALRLDLPANLSESLAAEVAREVERIKDKTPSRIGLVGTAILDVAPM